MHSSHRHADRRAPLLIVGDFKPRTDSRYWLETTTIRRWCSLEQLLKILSKLQCVAGSDTGSGVHFIRKRGCIVGRFTEVPQ